MRISINKVDLKMAPSPPPPVTTPPMKATSNGSFQGENPLDFALPLLILQIILVVVFTRFLAFLLKPLRQPRVIAEVIVSSSLCFVFCFSFHSLFTKSNFQFLHQFFLNLGEICSSSLHVYIKLLALPGYIH